MYLLEGKQICSLEISLEGKMRVIPEMDRLENCRIRNRLDMKRP